jgi:putative ATP-binding cassette transporter
MPSLRTPEVSLVVVEGDQRLISRDYAFADRESGRVMSDETPVPIASTSKGMAALPCCNSSNKARWSSTRQWSTTFPIPDERPARPRHHVRQLLSHTSGIPGGWTTDLPQDEHALERKVDSLASVALHRHPGSGYEYANDGYSGAGCLVQVVSSMTYEDYMEAHVLKPLHMLHSTFDVPLATAWGDDNGYTRWHGKVHPGQLPRSRGTTQPAVCHDRDRRRELPHRTA